MSIVKFILDGMLSIAGSNVEVRNYRSPDNGFRRDRENLSGDVKQVGTDMRKVITKHGSSYKRTSAY
jgi:hypothetical protein